MTAKAKTYFAAAVAVGVLLLFAAYPLLKDSQTLLAWLAIIATVAVLVLAVPLYDFVVVTIIRMSRGHSPFKGDTNHFSHRLVARP